MKSVLKWPGTKWRMAKAIVELIPDHKIYLEPFFGSGAVFFNKQVANTEILNDLDSQVTNLFKMIRDRGEELASAIELTPYSREEYKESYEVPTDELDKARLFLVRSNMARAGMQYYSSSWRHAGPVLGAQTKQRVTGAWNVLPERIKAAAIRLKDAEIENIDALKLIEKYNHPECFIYVDPPYLLSTRRQRYYNVEMTEDSEHIELLNVLKNHKGTAIISGYESQLYDELLSDWHSVEIENSAEQGKKRIEKLWCNFEIDKQIKFL